MAFQGRADPELVKKALADYHRDGIAVIENFLTDEEIESIRNEAKRLVREDAKEPTKKHVFDNDHVKDEYYSSAGDKVRFFYEPYAVNRETNEFLVPPEEGICKMGFALHMHNPFFKDFVRNQKVRDVFNALEYKDPTIIQTMINFKNPKVGGEWIPHQDTSYVTTTKPEYVVGFWFALDDATVENGCLQVIPGSHKWYLNRLFVRPKEPREDGALMEWTGPMAVYDQSMYKYLPAKKGSLVLIHGLVLHKSDPNGTDKSRWALAFHAFDRSRCDYVDGWLKASSPSLIPISAN